jgi:hypothetical protein
MFGNGWSASGSLWLLDLDEVFILSPLLLLGELLGEDFLLQPGLNKVNTNWFKLYNIKAIKFLTYKQNRFVFICLYVSLFKCKCFFTSVHCFPIEELKHSIVKLRQYLPECKFEEENNISIRVCISNH